MPKPEVFIAITKTLRTSLFSAASEERLATTFTVRGGDHDGKLTSADLTEQIHRMHSLNHGLGVAGDYTGGLGCRNRFAHHRPQRR